MHTLPDMDTKVAGSCPHLRTALLPSSSGGFLRSCSQFLLDATLFWRLPLLRRLLLHAQGLVGCCHSIAIAHLGHWRGSGSRASCSPRGCCIGGGTVHGGGVHV